MRPVLRFGLLAGMVLRAQAARACPLCVSETGRRVREGLFGPEFGPNLAATLLPFLIFLGIAAMIHLGIPWPAAGREPGTVPPGDGDAPHPDAAAGAREGAKP